MTIQEIADYLEENNYPVNQVMQLPTDRGIIYTGRKGVYLFEATFIETYCKKLYGREVTKEDLDDAIIFRKRQLANKFFNK